MSAVRKFDDYIRERVVKTQNPDKSRAEFLTKEAEKGYKTLQEYLSKIPLNEDNANDHVKRCYDIIMELTRAKMLLQGYSASGFGAHEAEVSFLRTLGFSENEVQFTDQIRFFRNGILYYGTQLDKEYAQKVIEFMKKVYPRLKENLLK